MSVVNAKIGKVVGTIMLFVGMWSVVASVGILGWQCYAWLRYGDFPALTLRDAFIFFNWYPLTTWIGINKAILALTSCSLAVIMFFEGMLFFWGGVALGGDINGL
jgi:hypothetical protein